MAGGWDLGSILSLQSESPFALVTQVDTTNVFLQGPVRTGVTVILPRGKRSEAPVFAGWFSLNGNGEVEITNTHSVGAVRDAIIPWARRHSVTKAAHRGRRIHGRSASAGELRLAPAPLVAGAPVGRDFGCDKYPCRSNARPRPDLLGTRACASLWPHRESPANMG